MSDVEHHRRIDVLAIGLFGLAVGALTLGVAQLGGIPDSNKVGTLVIALVFGGIVQILYRYPLSRAARRHGSDHVRVLLAYRLHCQAGQRRHLLPPRYGPLCPD